MRALLFILLVEMFDNRCWPAIFFWYYFAVFFNFGKNIVWIKLGDCYGEC